MIVLLPVSGLTYFLTTSQRDEGAPSLIETYLQRCPECEHILGPLSWGREKRTHDVVSGAFEFECDYSVEELPVFFLYIEEYIVIYWLCSTFPLCLSCVWACSKLPLIFLISGECNRVYELLETLQQPLK